MPGKTTVINPNQANKTVINKEMANRTVINEVKANKTIIDQGMSERPIRPADATKVDLPPVQKEANRQKAAEAMRKARIKGGNQVRPNPNKTVVDPDFGKSKPTDIRPPGSGKTQIKPKPGSASAPTEKMTRLPDLLEEQPPRTDLEEIEKAAKGEATIKNAPKGPPEPMQAADLKKELAEAKKAKPGKPGKTPDLKKLPPGKTLPKGTSGLAEYEKSKKPAKPGAAKSAPPKIKPKPGKGIGFGAKARSVLKSVGKVVAVGAVASVIGFAILDHLGVAIFEHVADEVLRRMGPKTDLSDYLPGEAKAKKVVWSTASYRRYSPSMGEAPLSTWLAEEITLHPPQNGILAFGISISDWPDDIVVSDINVNESRDGQSDWLCEGYQENLICRSLGSYPLNSKLKTVVTLHLASWPAYEVDKMLAAGNGSRSVYFIVK